MTVVRGVLFAALHLPEPGGDPDRAASSGPDPLSRRPDGRGRAVPVRVDRPWQAVYQELLNRALASRSSGELHRLGANALAISDGDGIRSVCAVVPRGRAACTVLGDLYGAGPTEIPTEPSHPIDGDGL